MQLAYAYYMYHTIQNASCQEAMQKNSRPMGRLSHAERLRNLCQPLQIYFIHGMLPFPVQHHQGSLGSKGLQQHRRQRLIHATGSRQLRQGQPPIAEQGVQHQNVQHTEMSVIRKALKQLIPEKGHLLQSLQQRCVQALGGGADDPQEPLCKQGQIPTVAWIIGLLEQPMVLSRQSSAYIVLAL